jgi:hypothetical protein
MGFPELFGYAKLFALKYPVEVGDIIEPAFIGDLGYSTGSIYQHSRGMAQPYFVQAVDKCFTGPFLYKTTK